MSGTPGGAAVPALAPHVRFRFDETRQAWVLLAPERLLLPDEPAVAVLRLVDGARTIDAIIDALAAEYEAPRAEIAADVSDLIRDLVEKRVVRLDSNV